MSPKKLVQDFYKSDALINSEIMNTFLHSDVLLDWNSSTGFKQLNRQDILDIAKELGKAYVRSKAKISHLLKDGEQITVRYSHYIMHAKARTGALAGSRRAGCRRRQLTTQYSARR